MCKSRTQITHFIMKSSWQNGARGSTRSKVFDVKCVMLRHPPPYKMCLMWAGLGLFCLWVVVPGRGMRHWPSPLQAAQSNPGPSSTPTTHNPSSLPTTTRTLSSTKWQEERMNTAKSSIFRNIEICWNGFSWLKIGDKVCVNGEQQGFQDGVPMWTLP